MSFDGAPLGFARVHDRWGVRNHVLVLPSVVCATVVAEKAAREHGVAIVHQHGCAHVGDDVEQTERTFIGIATNPNVGATVVVGLGCETIQGRRLAHRIAEAGQHVEFVGIQACGGTDAAVSSASEAVRRLAVELAAQEHKPFALEDLMIGIDSGPQGPVAAADLLAELACGQGASVVQALAQGGSELRGIWSEARRLAYSEPLGRNSLGVMEHAGRAGEQHAGLAAAGAQVLVSFCGRVQAPVGFAICPVVAVAGDSGMFAALGDDYDVDGSGPPIQVAEATWAAIKLVLSGNRISAELRGATDFSLLRLARTM